MDEQKPEEISEESTDNASVEETKAEETAASEAAEPATEAANDAPVTEEPSVPVVEAEEVPAPEAEAAEVPAEPVAETEEASVPESEPAEAPEPAAEAEEALPGEEVPELTLGGGAPADADMFGEAIEVVPTLRGKVDRFGVAVGTGRRKTSVARVRVSDGTGQVSINGRPIDEYFSTEQNRQRVQAPLYATDRLGKVDVWVRVTGGGTTGQAGAISLGIARALQAMDPELHGVLSEGGYLTRDGRMVERKKYGYKKARKSFQFSKR